MRRIGILGGTFNPPHIGHLVCAQEAAIGLELAEVVLMPVAQSPHKLVVDDPGPAHRLELCRLAAAGDPGIEASAMEVERGGASYTVDTLRALRDAWPEDELTWIVGGDAAASLPSWREPEEILRLARVAVAERGSDDREEIERRTARLEGSDRLEFFEMPRIDISSSLVRQRIRDGLPIRHLVPEAVERYVAEHGLYRQAVPAG